VNICSAPLNFLNCSATGADCVHFGHACASFWEGSGQRVCPANYTSSTQSPSTIRQILINDSKCQELWSTIRPRTISLQLRTPLAFEFIFKTHRKSTSAEELAARKEQDFQAPMKNSEASIGRAQPYAPTVRLTGDQPLHLYKHGDRHAKTHNNPAAIALPELTEDSEAGYIRPSCLSAGLRILA
jgi:hypothetical protein